MKCGHLTQQLLDRVNRFLKCILLQYYTPFSDLNSELLWQKFKRSYLKGNVHVHTIKSCVTTVLFTTYPQTALALLPFSVVALCLAVTCMWNGSMLDRDMFMSPCLFAVCVDDWAKLCLYKRGVYIFLHCEPKTHQNVLVISSTKPNQFWQNLVRIVVQWANVFHLALIMSLYARPILAKLSIRVLQVNGSWKCDEKHQNVFVISFTERGRFW